MNYHKKPGSEKREAELYIFFDSLYSDPLDIMDLLEKCGFPLPSFDEADETKMEFTHGSEQRIEELIQTVCGEDRFSSK